MSKRFLASLLILVLSVPLSARRDDKVIAVGGQPRFNRDFEDAELSEVLRFLGEAMGCKVYLGSGVEGRLTVSLRSVDPAAALHEVLASFCPELAYKQVGRNLVIASPDCRLRGTFRAARPPGDIRREFLLERAPAAKVIGALQERFGSVEFIPHPLLNGFYAVGNDHDLTAVSLSIPELDVVPGPPPVIRDFVQVRYGDLEELRPLYDSIFPDIILNVDTKQSTLILEGSPEAVEQAKELLQQLDQPLERIVCECKMFRLSDFGRQNLNFRWVTAPWPGQVRTSRFPSPAALELRVAKFKADRTLVPFQPPSGEARFPKASGPGDLYLGDVNGHSLIGLALKIDSSSVDGGKILCKLHGRFTMPEEPWGWREVTFDGETSVTEGETIAIEGIVTSEQALTAVQALPWLARLPVMGHLFRDIQPGERVLLMITPAVLR